MCRDPRDPDLVELENGAIRVVGNDWHSRLDKVFIENLGKFRKYDGRSVQDLMRALRNKVGLFSVNVRHAYVVLLIVERSLLRNTTTKIYRKT